MTSPEPDDGLLAQESAEEPEPEAKRKKQLPLWIEFPLLIAVALLIAVLIKTFLFQAFWIPSSSMEHTLLCESTLSSGCSGDASDRVFVSKITYVFSEIARGDIVVFDDPRPGFEQPDESVMQRAIRNLKESIGLETPQSEFIKRVIGVPGDVVEGKDGAVFVNGQQLEEPYLKDPDAPIGHFGAVEVPEGSLFVMGDNRNASQDSRFFGPIPIDDVVGKAFVIIWPLDRIGGI